MGARGIAVFALVVRTRYQIKASEGLEVRTCMECSLTMLTDVVSAKARRCGTDCKLLNDFATLHGIYILWLNGSAR